MAIPDTWVESPPTDMLLSFTGLILLLVDDYRILSGGLPPDGKGPEQEALLRPLGKLVEYRRPLQPRMSRDETVVERGIRTYPSMAALCALCKKHHDVGPEVQMQIGRSARAGRLHG
jgi:hypothetical protein